MSIIVNPHIPAAPQTPQHIKPHLIELRRRGLLSKPQMDRSIEVSRGLTGEFVSCVLKDKLMVFKQRVRKEEGAALVTITVNRRGQIDYIIDPPEDINEDELRAIYKYLFAKLR